MRGAGQAKTIGNIVKDGNKTLYTNPAGNELTWVDQSPKNINRDIDNFLNRSNVGKSTEASGCGLCKKRKRSNRVWAKSSEEYW